jgi:hypothetical protein
MYYGLTIIVIGIKERRTADLVKKPLQIVWQGRNVNFTSGKKKKTVILCIGTSATAVGPVLEVTKNAVGNSIAPAT